MFRAYLSPYPRHSLEPPNLIFPTGLGEQRSFGILWPTQVSNPLETPCHEVALSIRHPQLRISAHLAGYPQAVAFG